MAALDPPEALASTPAKKRRLTPAEKAAAARAADAVHIARIAAEGPLPTPEQAARLIGLLTWTERPTTHASA